ncbi:hypothetical protein DM02DRAFT_634271 [Periconia macrospinosa]|uniref:Rhodopsin domain-containing protein n=1 Tax=Periconia macrospinosa TaxID=97972 RepID=A0A2V1D6N3_9PLEO|nr:hypothetical protein DM02DRAFT_634271 [Periconia macrospinosa]
MAGESNHTIITDDDHGAILAIVSWCLGCALIFGVAIRIGIRLLTKHGPNLDDICILLAVVFAIGGIILVSFAVRAGLGMRLESMNENHLDEIQQQTYIITILYVMTIGIAKLSVAAFLYRLAHTRAQKVCVTLLSIFILCWTVAVTAVVIFACGLPRPWGFIKNDCIEVIPFWSSASAIDISTDIAMILLPINIVSKLDITARKKAVVMTIFALRILLIILSFMRVVLLDVSLSNTADISFDGIPFHAVTQAHAVLSILLACGPAFKPFLQIIQASMPSSRLAKHRTESSFGNLGYISQDSYIRRGSGGLSLDGHLASNENRSQLTTQYFHTSIYAHDGKKTSERNPSSSHRAHSSPIPSRGRNKIPPRRPPPPPEELRPDLSIFGPRAFGIGSNGAAVDSGKTHHNWYGRTSRESEGSEKSILNRT